MKRISNLLILVVSLAIPVAIASAQVPDLAREKMQSAKEKAEKAGKKASETVKSGAEKAGKELGTDQSGKKERPDGKPMGPKEDKPSKGDHGDYKGAEKGQGHAYGKNKGDLEGKAFGQARADSARAKHPGISEKQGRVKEAREKLALAKQKVEKARKNKTLTPDKLKASEEKIKSAEDKLTILEKRLDEASEEVR